MKSSSKPRSASIVKNVFEDLFELGKSTVQETGKAVESTLNPLHSLETNPQPNDHETLKNQEMKKKDNKTPLDLDKLQASYEDKDKAAQDAVRQRLFQLVKSGEQQAIDGSQQSKKSSENEELEEKERKRRETAAQQQSSQGAMPQGKVRKNILGGGRKKASVQQEQAEYKGGATKN